MGALGAVLLSGIMRVRQSELRPTKVTYNHVFPGATEAIAHCQPYVMRYSTILTP